jgi:hypothetical protein
VAILRDAVLRTAPQDEEVVIEHHPEDWIAFAIFWSLAFIVFLQFFTRYVLNDSLSWTEEIARYGLMWIVFIGGAMVTRRNSHIAVELLSNVMGPGPLRAALLAFVDLRAHEHPAHDGVRPADELRLRRRRFRLLPDADPSGAERLAQRARRVEQARRHHASGRGGLSMIELMRGQNSGPA